MRSKEREAEKKKKSALQKLFQKKRYQKQYQAAKQGKAVKDAYRFHDPERYDIIIFPGPEEFGQHPYYIKRIIGMPGETVQIKDGKVYINDKELKSDVYGITDYIDYPGIVEEPITLGDDEYFCLGDNRPVSQDSRYEEVGPVKRSIIVGKVWIRIWPLNKFGKVS